MLKIFMSVIFMTTAIEAAPARAQTSGFDHSGTPPERTDDSDLLNEHNLTPTGETVAHPGESQSGGETPLDLSIEKKDNKVDRSICKNC